jgi:cytochrome c biogenesis protein CcmG/thiol:disulfide interchange protein DsbE
MTPEEIGSLATRGRYTRVPHRRGWSGALVVLPLVGFLALAALFYARLGAGDASRIPSALLGKPAPSFDLPTLSMDQAAAAGRFSDADLRRGHVTLVNIFASWCAPCHDEHPFLLHLAADPALAAGHVQLVGIAYKDAAAKTRRFLEAEGNPYALIGMDEQGRAGIDWGVYGVPETFIVKGDGTIAYKFIGPMDDVAIKETILPQIAKLEK